MGVYIKGMEMPCCCDECRFLDEYGDYPCCIIADEQRGYNFKTREKRMGNCPLVPVPPHGDLIDRDLFIEFIKTHWDSYDQWFVEQLEARPTIIPAEEGE